MNIDTSSSQVSSAVNSSRGGSNSNSSRSSSSVSFDKELDSVSKNKDTKTEDKKVETKEEPQKEEDVKKDEQPEVKPDADKEANAKPKEEHHLNKDIVPSVAVEGGVDFTDYKYNNDKQSLLAKNIQDLINTRSFIAANRANLAEKATGMAANNDEFSAMNMSDGDALFFSDLVKNTDMSMQSIATQIQMQAENNVQAVAKSANVSSVLMDKLNEAMKTNQPFRIDFDKDVSVIIKVGKDGSITANFIPGDKAVEQYLKNNISFLKQRFDEENLSYTELSYSHEKNQQEQEKRKNKENDHE